MRRFLASRAVASVARTLWPSGWAAASLRCPVPQLASTFLRQPLYQSLATTPQASAAPTYKSKYVGVHWDRQNKQWQAQIEIEGKKQHIGYFGSEEDAARAYDKEAAPLNRPLNFPGPGQAQAVKRGAHGIVSRYTGVSWEVSHKKWRAQIEIEGKRTSLF